MESDNFIRRTLKVGTLRNSFKYASQGVVYLFLYHRNMRIIFVMGAAAIISALILDLSGPEMVVLLLTISLVFTAEMFNTGIEVAMDIISSQYHSRAKVIKDIAAAAVLVASVNAAMIGYFLFAKRLYLLWFK